MKRITPALEYQKQGQYFDRRGSDYSIYSNPIYSILDDMTANGIKPPMSIETDGAIHRFGKKKRYWYIAYLHPTPVCIFGDWKNGVTCKYIHKSNKPLSHAERIQVSNSVQFLKQKHLKKLQAQYDKASLRARAIWEKSAPAVFHEYLKRKNVLPFGVKVDKHKNLVIPVTDGQVIHSLQFIAPDGQKLFLKGGKTKEMYFPIKVPDNPSEVLICEGFATGSTLHMETRIPVIVAFNANNLIQVAKITRIKYPSTEITICGDNDHAKEGNPGKKAAIAAARACQGKWTIPDFKAVTPSPKQTDFNDLYLMQEAAGE